jgi:hypothetical protein
MGRTFLRVKRLSGTSGEDCLVEPPLAERLRRADGCFEAVSSALTAGVSISKFLSAES